MTKREKEATMLNTTPHHTTPHPLSNQSIISKQVSFKHSWPTTDLRLGQKKKGKWKKGEGGRKGEEHGPNHNSVFLCMAGISSPSAAESTEQLNLSTCGCQAVRTPAFSGMVRCWCSGDPLGVCVGGPGMELVLMVLFMYVCMYVGFVLQVRYILSTK